MVLKQQKIVVSITGGQTLTPTYTILNIETGLIIHWLLIMIITMSLYGHFLIIDKSNQKQ